MLIFPIYRNQTRDDTVLAALQGREARKSSSGRHTRKFAQMFGRHTPPLSQNRPLCAANLSATANYLIEQQRTNYLKVYTLQPLSFANIRIQVEAPGLPVMRICFPCPSMLFFLCSVLKVAFNAVAEN